MSEIPEREETIPLAEEQIEISKRAIERGRVIVRKRVDTRDAIAEAVLRQEDVTVERVPVGLPVETAPSVREEDGVLIVPVLEEQLVVETRLVLKEEIRITRRSRTEVAREPVRLRSERAEVIRLEGRNRDQSEPEQRSTTDDGTDPYRTV
jgi:uncharacterized protein (TIGR02271 family)